MAGTGIDDLKPEVGDRPALEDAKQDGGYRPGYDVCHHSVQEDAEDTIVRGKNTAVE